jgi:hypothetical protein
MTRLLNGRGATKAPTPNATRQMTRLAPTTSPNLQKRSRVHLLAILLSNKIRLVPKYKRAVGLLFSETLFGAA